MVDGAMRFISMTARGAAGNVIADARTSTATAAELDFMQRSLSETKDDAPGRPELNSAERESYNGRFLDWVLSVTTAPVIFMISRNGVVEWCLATTAHVNGTFLSSERRGHF
jgi:hypothetical protein